MAANRNCPQSGEKSVILPFCSCPFIDLCNLYTRDDYSLYSGRLPLYSGRLLPIVPSAGAFFGGEGIWNVLTAIFPNIPKVCSEAGILGNGGQNQVSCNNPWITALECSNMQELRAKIGKKKNVSFVSKLTFRGGSAPQL